MKGHKIVTAVVLVGVCAALAGCGGKETTTVDPAPFKAALDAHCAANHMDMMVAEFKELEVEGDTATGKAAMRDKSELYGLTIVWDVKFEREGERWKVKQVVR